ncbi:DUF4272 domain-containing protein [Nocardia sp. NPDC049190]|uniref:DUF4272 domain-containing protein n=1 Tax=Nocardia sp. NPDC049190 TaxID=3155650 RepID=UPI0033E357EE
MTLSTRIRLEQHGVRLKAEHLPEIDEVFSVHVRSPTEIAKRIIALHALLGVIFHRDPREVKEWMEEENFLHELTEREQWAFALTELPEAEMLWRQQTMQTNLLTWRAESLYVLLWASGAIPSMIEPDERIDGSSVIDHLPGLGEPLQPFIQKATLRPRQEIVEELHYYLALRLCQGVMDHIDAQVVEERYYALYWIACADDSEWDEDEDEDDVVDSR